MDCKIIHISEHNATGSDQTPIKNYYLSQRISYNGDNSALACLSTGMRLAILESEDEQENLVEIAKENPKLFNEEIFIDRIDSIEKQETDSCFTFEKSSGEKAILKNVDCRGSRRRFLCESVDVDEFENITENVTDKFAAVKAKFFSPFGDYGESNFHVHL